MAEAEQRRGGHGRSGRGKGNRDLERIAKGREGQRKTHRPLLWLQSLIVASCVRTLYLIRKTALEIWAQGNMCRMRNFFSP